MQSRMTRVSRPAKSSRWRARTAFAALTLVASMLVAAQPAFAVDPPANDDFADATELTGTSGTTSGTNVEATAEVGEPTNHAADCCDPDLGDASVWYKWTAPSSGVFAFDTFGSLSSFNADTVLGVYTGSLGALTEVNSNEGFSDDDGGGSFRDSRVVFSATASTTYYIGVSQCCGGPDTFEAPFTLNWAAATRPANDNFASATAISGSSGSLGSQSNFDASREAGELSAHFDLDLGGPSVWYSWQAPSTGGFTFSALGTLHLGGSFAGALAAYTGSLGSLTEVAYDSDGDIAFSATSGMTYAIGVGGCCGYSNGVYPGDTGSFTLAWTDDATPPETSITSTSRGQHSVTFSFTGSDNLTTPANLDFECKIDEEPLASCTSPKTYSAITGGLHTVTVRAVDASGNVDLSPAVATIRAKGSPKTTG